MRLLDLEYKAPLYTHIMETLNGLVTIRAFEWQESFLKKAIEVLDESQRPNYLLYCLQRWLTFSVDMIIMVMAVVLILLATTLREQIGPAYIGIALSNVLAFSATMKSTITSWVRLEVSLAAVARVRRFALEVPPEGPIRSSGEDTTELNFSEKYAGWPGEGAIELRNVTASYS